MKNEGMATWQMKQAAKAPGTPKGKSYLQKKSLSYHIEEANNCDHLRLRLIGIERYDAAASNWQ